MLKKIKGVLTKKQKFKLLLLCMMIFLGSMIELLSVSLILPLTTIATDEKIIYRNKRYALLGEILGISTPQEYVIVLSVILIVIYIFKNLYISFMYYCQYRFQYKNERDLALKILKYYVNKDYLYHTSINVADIQRNVSLDVTNFWNVVYAYTSMFNEGLVCVSLIVFLMLADFVSTMSMGLIIVFFLVTFSGIYRNYSSAYGAKLRKISSNRTKWLLQTFGGIKEIKITEKADFFVNHYKQAYDDYVNYQTRQSMLAIIPKPLMEAVCICGLLTVTVIRLSQGAELKTYIPVLSTFVMAAFRMLPSFNKITSYMNQIMNGKASTESVYDDITKMREQQKNIGKVSLEKEKLPFVWEEGEDIHLENLTFRYPSGQAEILADLSLTIPYNKSVAFIGKSGAGKTTLADIILGILLPQKGEIRVGEVNIFECLEEWHSKIGYIPQSIYLMDDTIRNNIAFGIDENQIDNERVHEVIKQAELGEFVNSLPEGINTMVGDRGVRLSGGQRQRIGIARALYTKPQLLVMDEATSALDTETEKAVMDAIENLQGSCTMLIIAHRISTIKKCDLIYEIGNGTANLKKKEDLFDK